MIPYRNPALPTSIRVKDLLSRMTAEEKFYQLFMVAQDPDFDSLAYRHGIFGIEISSHGLDENPGQQLLNYNATSTSKKQVEEINRMQHYLVNKTRLGIPGIFYGEALHGVVGKEGIAYPQSIALAATFNPDLVEQVFEAIALESKQRGWRQVLSPVVNVATDVRWGRVEETYGEDPFLNSLYGASYVRTFQSHGIIATPKHFVANVGDGGRDSYPMHLDSLALHRIHLPPFQACIEAGAGSIMTSYNSLNGSPCSMNAPLLNGILKKQWGFDGFVISDAGAVGGANVLHNTTTSYGESGLKAVEAGLDVIFQTSIQHSSLFSEPFLSGKVSQMAVDSAVARVLKAKFELGLFEQPYAHWEPLPLDQYRMLAQEAAEESVVLLKNNKKTLPFDLKNKSIAVIGKDAVECRLGGYSGTGLHAVSMLEGLRQWASECDGEVFYAEGPGRGTASGFQVVPSSSLENLQSFVCSGPTFDFQRRIAVPINQVDFHYTFYSPSDQVSRDDFSMQITGEWICPVDGEVELGLEGNDGFKLRVQGHGEVERWDKVSFHQEHVVMQVNKNQRIPFVIDFYETLGNAQLRLVWRQVESSKVNRSIEDAVKVAKKADMIVVVVGIEEGEFRDRSSLNLPGDQEELIHQLAALSAPTVVLLVGGSAIEVTPWLEEVDAVLMNWYGGEAQGEAVRHVLSGAANPSGKLPITFPIHEGQLPLSYWHEPTGRGDDYDDLTGWPMFPFGYGLSYTQFDWQREVIYNADSSHVEVELVNTGDRAGKETVQLYALTRHSKQLNPVIQLVDFRKVRMEPGERKRVDFDLLKVRNKMDIKEGDEVIWAFGNSSRNLPIKLAVH